MHKTGQHFTEGAQYETALLHQRMRNRQPGRIDHPVKGSRYDGYFERVAERIEAVITPRQRETVLRLKYETPDDEKIMGIEYYLAVIRDGIADYPAFVQWRKQQPADRIIEWIP